MEKQEYKSKWDELVRQIGVEVSPEIEQREQAAASTTAETAQTEQQETSEAAAPRPLPKKQAADWDNLAGELGLPPAPPEEPTAEPLQEKPRQEVRDVPSARAREPVEREPREPSRRRRPRAEERQERGGRARDSRRPGREDREESEQRRGSRRPRGEEVRRPREGREESRRDRDDRGRHRQAREEEQPTADVSEVGAEESPQVESPPPREQPSRSPAVSLWHKIFGSPAEQSAKQTQAVPLQDEPVRAEEVSSGVPATPHEVVEDVPTDDEQAFGDFDEAVDAHEDVDVAEAEPEPGERKRGRPRRRRRGGRGRKSGDRRGEDRPAAQRRPVEAVGELDAEFDDIDEEDAVESFGYENGGAGLADDIEEVETDEGDVSEGGERRGKSAAQRAIPSWDEAIGFIVDSNMQARSQRRPASRSDSRGGPRGRSRGRRRS